MGKKVGISLIVSAEMSSRGENDVVRLPKKSRQYLGLERGKVILGKGFYQIEAAIKAAYASDVRRLVSLVRSGKVKEEDAPLIGFVSQSTHKKVATKPGPNAWLSDGLGNITVGCDPEFGLIGDNGILVRGDIVLPGSKKARFGEDGPGVEIRPAPSQNHLEVVQNIKEALESAPKQAEPYRWVGGATFSDSNRVYWFGGHIHFGRPKELEPEKAELFFKNIARVLDYFMSWPMLSFDTPNPQLRRNGCKDHHYGVAGDIRTKEGNSRFEYRVLSGLWLTHPVLARMIIGAAKSIVEHLYNKASEHDFDTEYVTDTSGSGYASPMIKDCGILGLGTIVREINKGAVKPLGPEKLSKWADKFRSLDTYQDYHREVEALIAVVEASPSEVVQHLDLDIKKNWLEDQPLLEESTTKVRAALEAVEGRL